MGESVKKIKGHSGNGRPMNASWTIFAVMLEYSDVFFGPIGPEAGTNSVGVFVPHDCCDHTRNRYFGPISSSAMFAEYLSKVQNELWKIISCKGLCKSR